MDGLGSSPSVIASSPTLRRLFTDQQHYAFVAVAVSAMFWAMDQNINPYTVILYSFTIGNLLTPLLRYAGPLFYRRPFPQNFVVYAVVLIVATIPVYLISTVIVWRFAPPAPQALGHYLRTGWKVPVLVTLLWGSIKFLYDSARDRLLKRTRELEHAVEVREAQVEMQEQELKRALEIQRSLLPKRIPQVEGFEVAGTWQPARVVGGDYFDVLELPDRRLALCIADVVGKSVSAALLMANVQATVRAFAQDSHSPARLCARVNEILCSNIATGKFVTFFYGILDPATHKFEYANAGHLQPLVVGNSGEVRRAPGGGIVLGLFPGAKYEDASISLQAGDKLLLFTDGIVEAFSPEGEEFGESRIAAVARAHRTSTAQQVSDLVFLEVSRFCHEQFHDDATLMVVSSGHTALA